MPTWNVWLEIYGQRKTHNIFKITNISLLFRSFVNVKRRICCFVYIYLYIYICLCISLSLYLSIYLSIYLYTAHIVFIHIPSVAVKPVHIFMVRNRVCKNCLMAELFPLFCAFWLYFNILIYISSYHHKECASN